MRRCLVTALVSNRTGGYALHQSVCSQGIPQPLVSDPFPREVPQSLVPSLFPGRYLVSGLGPFPGEYPSQDHDRGTPQTGPGQGVPLGHDTPWTGYTSGGAPLSVTQENFLVIRYFRNLNIF